MQHVRKRARNEALPRMAQAGKDGLNGLKESEGEFEATHYHLIPSAGGSDTIGWTVEH